MLLVLAGCAMQAPSPVQSPGQMPPAPGGPLLARCGADRLIGMIGRPVSALPKAPAGGTLRILRPGDPVTEDFRDTRLNIILDSGDHVTALSCG